MDVASFESSSSRLSANVAVKSEAVVTFRQNWNYLFSGQLEEQMHCGRVLLY